MTNDDIIANLHNQLDEVSNSPASASSSDASAGPAAPQSDMPTPAQAGIQRPVAVDQALRQGGVGAFKTLAPRLYDYMTQPNPSTPSMTPNRAGKVTPADYDPRTLGALEDLRNLGLDAMPEGGWAARAMGAVAGAVSPSAEAAQQQQRTAAVPAQASRPPPGQPGPAPTAAAPAVPQPQGPPGPAPTAAVPQPSASIRPNFTPQDMDRLSQLGTEMGDLNKSIDTVGKRSDIGLGSKKALIAPLQKQIDAKQGEIDRIRDNVRQAQATFDLAGQPIGVRNPPAVAVGRAIGLGAGLATGAMKGLSGKGQFGRAVAYGGMEGAAGVMVPNLFDLGAAPGTPARETAERNLAFISDPTKIANWDYARRVIAPEMIGGGVLGIAGYGFGSGVNSLLNWRRRPAPSVPAAPAVPAASTTPSTPSSSYTWPTDPEALKSLQSVAYKTPNGQWRVYVEGKNRRLPKGLEPRP
jgi:hypothetical protein